MVLYCFGGLMFRCDLLRKYDEEIITVERRIVAAQKVR